MEKMFEFDLQRFAEQADGAAEGTAESGAEQQEGGLLSSDSGEQSTDSEATGTGLLSGDGKEAESDNKGGAEKSSEEKQTGAPEKYEAFKMPEGVQVDEQALGEYQALAKEIGLSQESAQKLVDYQAKLMQKQVAMLDQNATQQSNAWRAETVKAFNKEEISDAVRGFRSAPKDVQQMLAACGFDNHKSFVEFFMKVGRSIKEDKFETGKPSGKGSEKSAASVLYPELN